MTERSTDILSSFELIEKLDQLAADGTLHGFTLWKSKHGYQANMQTGANAGWRVRSAPTPSEAIALVLGMDWIDEADDRLGLPPLPVRDVDSVDFGEAAISDLVADAEAEADEPANTSLFD